jgi:hypothetical protein
MPSMQESCWQPVTRSRAHRDSAPSGSEHSWPGYPAAPPFADREITKSSTRSAAASWRGYPPLRRRCFEPSISNRRTDCAALSRNHGPFGISLFSRTNGGSSPRGSGYGPGRAAIRVTPAARTAMATARPVTAGVDRGDGCGSAAYGSAQTTCAVTSQAAPGMTTPSGDAYATRRSRTCPVSSAACAGLSPAWISVAVGEARS